MTEPPSPASEIPAAYEDYMIRSAVEIAYVLRAVQHKRELVAAFFNGGQDFILTSILDVGSDEALILDCGPDEAVNARLLASDRVLLSTTQDGAKVQFALDRLEKTTHCGRAAFRAALPRELLKLQRREYYRLPAPVVQPIKCSIAFSQGGKAEVTVTNISLGGIAIVDHQNLVKLNVDDRYDNCRILLPALGEVTTAIEIRNQRQVQRKDGGVGYRAGCMFLGLASAQQATIQRYIIKLERDRRTKGSQ